MVFRSARQRKFVMAKLRSRNSTRVPLATREFISKQIRKDIKLGKSQKQAIAIAFSKAKKKFPKQREALTLKNQPKITFKRQRRLLGTIIGAAIALQLLRTLRFNKRSKK